MAGITIKMLSDEPILLAAYNKTFTSAELIPTLAALTAALDSAPEPVFYIIDMTEEPPFELQQFLKLNNDLTREQNALLHHPNMKEHLIVTRNLFFKVAAKGLSAEIFGGVKARTFDTLDEALAYARAEIKRTPST